MAKPASSTAVQPARQPESFTERYRGTVFDTEPRAERAPAPPSRWPVRLLLLGLALLTVGLVAGAVYGFGLDRDGGPSGEALESQMTRATVNPLPASPIARPTATARPTAAPVTPSAPTVVAWREDGTHPASRFIKRWSGADTSYSLSGVWIMSADGQKATAIQGMSVSGSNYHLYFNVKASRDQITGTIVRVGSDWYSQAAGRPWYKRSDRPMPVAVLGDLGTGWADRLEYLGEADLHGRRLHRVRLVAGGWPTPMGTIAMVEIHPDPVPITWDVWVDQDGNPFSAQAVVQVATQASGWRVLMKVEMTYTFEAFGEKVNIKRPRVGSR